nr:MAG TPA: hypothetical protein [Caudoviricetes sp.]
MKRIKTCFKSHSGVNSLGWLFCILYNNTKK